MSKNGYQCPAAGVELAAGDWSQLNILQTVALSFHNGRTQRQRKKWSSLTAD
jgi:hypothetical protein